MQTIPERVISGPTLTASEAAILGLVSRRPMSGYDLKKAIERSVGYFWAPAKSQIYALLPRLVESRLVTRRTVLQRERPNKHVYRITKRGLRALTQWLATAPADPGPARSPLLLKLFFGELADPDVLAAHVRELRAELVRLRTELDEIDAQADPSNEYAALTRSYGRAYANALVDWADDAERKLEELRREKP